MSKNALYITKRIACNASNAFWDKEYRKIGT